MLKGDVNRELLTIIRAVHSGQKRVPAEIASQLAEHAGKDILAEGEIEVLRLIAAGNAYKEIASQLDLAEDTVKRRYEYPFQAGGQRPHARRDHRPEARVHPTVIPLKYDWRVTVSDLAFCRQWLTLKTVSVATAIFNLR